MDLIVVLGNILVPIIFTGSRGRLVKKKLVKKRPLTFDLPLIQSHLICISFSLKKHMVIM